MTRNLKPICLNAEGVEFELLYTLCNRMFPRRKHKGYLNENRKYVLYWNLTKEEHKMLIGEYARILITGEYKK